MKLNWGTGLAITMVLFMGFIIYLVVSSTNGTSDFLEDEDYYEKGLHYQDHIELEKNTLPFKDSINVDESAGILTIQLPKMDLHEVKVHLYNPVDGNLDQKKIITSLFDASNVAKLNTSDLKKGKWTVKLNWLDNNKKGYFYERSLMIE